MKKIIFILCALAVCSFMLQSCGKSTPKDVAREWLTDFYHMDYDGAKKLSTDEAKTMLTTIQGFTNSFADSIKQKAKLVTITIKDVKVEGDKATVSFTASNEPTADVPPLKLVKQNDKWLVVFTKSDFKPDDDSKGAPTGGATIMQDAPATRPAATTTPADASMTPDTTKQQ